jgi:hypothetical protein
VLRLAAAAERIRRGYRPQSQQIPDFTERGDEIGELSGVLRNASVKTISVRRIGGLPPATAPA